MALRPWTGGTPCAEWDLRSLVNHVVVGNYWVAPLVQGSTIAEVGDRYDGDLLGDDPLAAYDASAAEADAAARAEGAMAAPCAVSYGPVPGEVYLGDHFIDVLVHGWDIARASGQEATLDPELAEICLTVIEPDRDMLEGSGISATTSRPGRRHGAATTARYPRSRALTAAPRGAGTPSRCRRPPIPMGARRGERP